MRSLIVILVTFALSVTVSGIDTTPKNTLEKDILNLLTKWRSGDKGPFSFPLPSLEAIELPKVNGAYRGHGVKITFETSELKLTGLKDFSVDKLDAFATNLTASGTVSVPVLTLEADDYNIKGTAMVFIPTNGSGKLSANLTNSQVSFSIGLKNNSSSTWVDSLQLSFQVSGVQVSLTNGPLAVSTVLNNFGPSILQSYHTDIVQLVRGLMVPVIDEFLKNITPDQLFNTIA